MTLNNRYCSLQNSNLTHEVPLHPVKVSVWYAEGARRIVVPVIFSETINCVRYLRVERQHFQHLLRSVNFNYFTPKVIGLQVCGFIDKIRMRLAPGGAPVAVKC
jgi:hypothetical protein